MEQNIVLKFEHIYKEYPGVHALKDVSFELKEGEVHALVGENGAGKSTLIKTCSGAISPTAGKVIVNGSEFSSLTPIVSRENGIGVIYQEFNLVKEMSVAENIFLGRAIRNGVVIDRKAMNEKTVELFDQLDIKIDPDMLVKNLTTGYQQMVEIAKAISMNSRILIMDEPSASLTNRELDALFLIIRKLKSEGVAIIYISHRLDEIFEVTDRVSVMRDGELITTINTADSSRDELVKLMVGRELKETFPVREMKPDSDVLLEVKHLSGNGLTDISFHVKKGEILGLGGLIGAGRTEFAEILFGVAHATAGSIKLRGEEIHVKSPSEAISKGIALVPEDRKQQGVLLHMSIQDNITMPILKRISKCSVINRKREKTIIDEYKDSLRIKAPSVAQLTGNLSGGNQQKVVLAKWLATNPDIIVFDEPTRGIDVGAKQEIYMIMDRLAKEGKTLIMISSEMEELIGVSDRIIVLAEGRMTGELKKEEFDQEKILQYASMS